MLIFCQIKGDNADRLTSKVMNELRQNLSEEFPDSADQSKKLVRRLGCLVPGICRQWVTGHLSANQMATDLRMAVNPTKLYKDVDHANEVSIEWLVETIVNLIITNYPNNV